MGLQNLGWKIGWWESLQDPQKILVKNNRFSQKKPKGVNSLIILIVLAKPIYIYIHIFPIFSLFSQYFHYFCVGIHRSLHLFTKARPDPIPSPLSADQRLWRLSTRGLATGDAVVKCSCFMMFYGYWSTENGYWINWIHISGATLQGVICFTYFSWNLGFVLEPFRQVRSTVVFQGSDDGSLGSPKAVVIPLFHPQWGYGGCLPSNFGAICEPSNLGVL